MLLTIVIVLGLFWLLGFSVGLAGSFIHLLLVVALIVLLYDRLTRRSHRV